VFFYIFYQVMFKDLINFGIETIKDNHELTDGLLPSRTQNYKGRGGFRHTGKEVSAGRENESFLFSLD
jgi:hypothetical protein